MNIIIKSLHAASIAVVLAVCAVGAQAQIKIAYVDPLSGGAATIGEHGLKHLHFLVETINAKGGVLGGQKLEAVAYDNKGSPQESLVQVQKAIDAGVRFMTQGNGSGAAIAISEFVSKYNERNPGKEVLYFNYAAVDPALTNEKCSFWHFRWDANSDIKMAALTNFMKDKKDIKKVYIIGQDYSFGHAVRGAANAMMKEKRPDIQIVGDELHPLLKITDFAPYIAKIKASGADSVITGNWGNDISLLLKAAADAGLQVNWYTYYAGGAGGPTAIKQTGLDHRVFQITEWHTNVPAPEMEAFADAVPEEVRRREPAGLVVPAHEEPDGHVRRRAEQGEVGRAEESGGGAARHEVQEFARRRDLHAPDATIRCSRTCTSRRSARERNTTKRRPAGAGRRWA